MSGFVEQTIAEVRSHLLQSNTGGSLVSSFASGFGWARSSKAAPRPEVSWTQHWCKSDVSGAPSTLHIMYIEAFLLPMLVVHPCHHGEFHSSVCYLSINHTELTECIIHFIVPWY